MKRSITIFLAYCFILCFTHADAAQLQGTAAWDIITNDIAIDISILSKICNIDNELASLVAPLTADISLLNSIYSTDQTTFSKLVVIDTRTSNIQSNVNNIYILDQSIASTVNNIYSIDQIINSKVNVINRTDQSIFSEVMIIDSKTTILQSSVNNVFNLDQTISSQVDSSISLDTTIFSLVAALSNCCCNNANTQQLTSIYGEQVSENRYDNLSIQFQYGIPDLTTNAYTQGGGTITTSNSMAVLSTAASTTSIAQLQSAETIVYRSGHDAYAIFTVSFPNVPSSSSVLTSSQFIGPIDYQNGFAVGFNGGTFGVMMRNNTNGTINNTFVPQSQFNGDTLNGNGPSGFNYNPAFINTFRIDYGYLGGSIIKFRVMNSNGNWITFHTIRYPNTATTPSILQPFLPITARVENLSNNSVITLQTLTWNAGTLGLPNSAPYRYFQANNKVTTSSATPVHILTIQNPLVFNNQPNHIQARVSMFGGGSSIATSNLGSSVYLVKNATVTGTSFTPVNSGNSVMLVSTTGSYAAGTGQRYIRQTTTSHGMGPISFVIPKNSFNVLIYPGETLTILGNAATTSVSIFGAVAWEEQF